MAVVGHVVYERLPVADRNGVRVVRPAVDCLGARGIQHQAIFRELDAMVELDDRVNNQRISHASVELTSVSSIRVVFCATSTQFPLWSSRLRC